MTITGWFPSFTAKGERRVLRVKTDSGSRSEPLNELRLRCITDGNVRHFVDDLDIAQGQPNQCRQQIVQKISARNPDGLPMFFVDEPCGSMPFHGLDVPIPVADDRIRAVLATNIEKRNGFAAALAARLKQDREAMARDLAGTFITAQQLAAAAMPAPVEHAHASPANDVQVTSTKGKKS